MTPEEVRHDRERAELRRASGAFERASRGVAEDMAGLGGVRGKSRKRLLYTLAALDEVRARHREQAIGRAEA